MKKIIAGFLFGIVFILLISAAIKLVVVKEIKSTSVPSFVEIGPKTSAKKQNNSILGTQTKNNEDKEKEDNQINRETVTAESIPIFTPSNVKTKVRTNESLVLALETASSKEEVLSFYQKNLASLGFTQENSATFGSAKVHSFLKPGERVLLIIYSASGKTTLVLTTQPNP